MTHGILTEWSRNKYGEDEIKVVNNDLLFGIVAIYPKYEYDHEDNLEGNHCRVGKSFLLGLHPDIRMDMGGSPIDHDIIHHKVSSYIWFHILKQRKY